MNRLVTENVRDVGPDRLPPRRPEGRARILFINHNLLGHVTQARNIRQYTGARDDIDAVHIDVVRPFWIKVANKSLPLAGYWDLRHYRALLLWRPIIRKWLCGPLDLSHFDLVHCLNPHYAWGLIELKAQGLFPQIRLAVHTDCTSVLMYRELGWPRPIERPVIDIERRIYAASDLVIGMSEWSAKSMQDDYGVPAHKLCLARGCVVQPPAPVPKDSPTQIPSRLPRIIFVGNDWVRKGGPTLVRIHQQHFADRAELHIVSRQATPDAAARNVIWHGTVPHQKLLTEMLSSADLMAMPTSNDMSPFAVLEAAAAGLPVVSTRMGGIPEMVLHGQTGLLFDPGDLEGFVRAVDRLLGDAALRRQMGHAAREHVSKVFNPDENYGGLLDRLVALCAQQHASQAVAGSPSVNLEPAAAGAGSTIP